MKNTKLKALIAASLLAILPTALAVACSVEDAPPASPTIPTTSPTAPPTIPTANPTAEPTATPPSPKSATAGTGDPELPRPPDVTGIRISPEQVLLDELAPFRIRVFARMADGTYRRLTPDEAIRIRLTQDDPDAQEISAEGVITPRYPSEGSITAALDGMTDTIETAFQPPMDLPVHIVKKLVGFKPEPAIVTIRGVGSQLKPEILGHYSNGETHTLSTQAKESLRFTSTNPDAATVAEDGMITAAALGGADIIVTATWTNLRSRMAVLVFPGENPVTIIPQPSEKAPERPAPEPRAADPDVVFITPEKPVTTMGAAQWIRPPNIVLHHPGGRTTTIPAPVGPDGHFQDGLFISRPATMDAPMIGPPPDTPTTLASVQGRHQGHPFRIPVIILQNPLGKPDPDDCRAETGGRGKLLVLTENDHPWSYPGNGARTTVKIRDGALRVIDLPCQSDLERRDWLHRIRRMEDTRHAQSYRPTPHDTPGEPWKTGWTEREITLEAGESVPAEFVNRHRNGDRTQASPQAFLEYRVENDNPEAVQVGPGLRITAVSPGTARITLVGEDGINWGHLILRVNVR